MNKSLFSLKNIDQTNLAAHSNVKSITLFKIVINKIHNKNKASIYINLYIN